MKIGDILTQVNHTPGRHVCPACKGGKSGEASLQVYDHSDRYVVICFRDQCGVSGVAYKGLAEREADPLKQNNPTAPEWLARPKLFPLTDMAQDVIWKRWHLVNANELGWKLTAQDRLYIPLLESCALDPHRYAASTPAPDAHVLRTYRPGDTRTKALTYYSPGFSMSIYTPGIYHACKGTTGPIILVEDPVSASRLRLAGLETACILGTRLSERAVERLSHCTPRVVVALDADALRTAARTVAKLKFILPEVRLRRLTKDIKDMTTDEFEEFVQWYDELQASLKQEGSDE